MSQSKLGVPPRGFSNVAARSFCLFDTALGHCGIAWGAHGIAGVQLPEASAADTRARMRTRFPAAPEVEPANDVRDAIHRIQALLRGVRDDLRSVGLDMQGVPQFNRRVYELARTVPPGRVTTYGELAKQLGAPGAARAVGQALGRNPFAPVVPCHRVLAAAYRAGGFSADGGTRTKLRMLEIEGAVLGGTPGLFDGKSAPGA